MIDFGWIAVSIFTLLTGVVIGYNAGYRDQRAGIFVDVRALDTLMKTIDHELKLLAHLTGMETALFKVRDQIQLEYAKAIGEVPRGKESR